VEAQWVASTRHHARPRVEQPPYSIFARGIERDVLPTCARYGMGVLVWGPLNSGWLSGKYTAGDIPTGSRGERWGARGKGWQADRAPVQRKRELLAALEALARDHDLTLLQLALAFSVEHPAVSSAIIGPRTMEQLEQQLGAVDVRLTAGVLDAIDELVAPGTNVDHESDAGWVPPWISDASLRRRG
jgi:aryl-alcohol dehydrogenase-like predicted oxidoreductase